MDTMEFPLIVLPLTGQHWSWMEERTHLIACEDSHGFVLMRNGEILGATVFDSWTSNSCHGHIAIEDPKITRRLLRVTFDYVFIYANRGVMIATVIGNNTRALRLVKGIGFKELFRVEDGHKLGVDTVVLEMRRENCRWITPVNKKAA